MESDVQVLMKRAADLVIMLTYSEPGQKDLDDVLKDTGVTVLRESGIRNDHPYAGALVTLLVLGRNFKWLTAAVQHMMLSRFLPSTADRFEVLNLERGWRLLLSTLPFTSFDEKGTMEPDYDCKEILGQWPIVIELLAPVFSAYEDEVFVRALDGYCRVLFCRCFHIITYWKWQSWQDILQYLFKFFSTRKLRNLPSEGLCGSPAFLTQLEKTPTLQVEVRDSTFHVFLKIIGVSWHHMAKVYDQQKLQNFARRLIPLHERQFPKDESLNQQDLDELRNHHDLLSTLYWAIPEKFRFRVATIRWLVQPLNSHTEASLININSWLRLTRFKLSTDEDISGLTPFTDWHSAFTKDMLKLHALARTEIEAQAVGNNRFSRELLDSVIEENQKQIETLLGTTLINMALALRAAPSIDHARAILQGFPLVELLDRFHAINWRSSTVVCQVLDIILAFTATETCQTTSQRQAPIVIDKNDESQEEYGDWSAFAELSNEDLVTPGPGIHFLNDTVRPVVLRLASRYFGDDRSSVEPVLYRIIDCWVAVALLLVRYGLRGWSTQLNQYNPESWTSLPWTDRTRKLTPYVLARLIEADHSVYTQCKQEILKHWISCIVERGSVLIHQHSLTSALLNVDRRSPLLTNLPFSRVGTESYAIALDEFSQRRLSLISSVLSNMREHVTSLYQNKSPDYQTVNESYRELVETLMRVMKSNYQELGQGNQYVQGQYVGFVHSVIGFLQQHVQQICPLDNFFTDPKAFPLPADDPSYIAAKLLSYEVRLTDEKIGMQLVTFIQSVSERAAVDGQQTHFVDQLYTAVSRSLERTRTGKPTMLDIIVTCVLPGYMEASLKNPVAWLLARPFLQSLTRTFNDMLLHVNVYDQDDVSSTIWTLSFFFSELDQSLRLLVDHPGLLDEPRILVTMVSYLETIMASVPAIDYIARSTSDAQVLVSYVQVFNQMALFAYSCLSDPATAWAPDLLDLDGGRSNATPAILLMLHCKNILLNYFALRDV
ncbi:hypothetical protein KEM56_001912 [Ascosphaera pollenicola]|nr:hypothetical protein KEM56_001912 [Ascosphaera pollenicola]